MINKKIEIGKATIIKNGNMMIENITVKGDKKAKPRQLPDPYKMELNTERIAAYRALAKKYNISESTVREIFCRGVDWYKKIAESYGILSTNEDRDIFFKAIVSPPEPNDNLKKAAKYFNEEVKKAANRLNDKVKKQK